MQSKLGKRRHIVADTLLPMFLGLRKLGNICCGHKMFLNKIRNIFFLRPGHKICVRNKCCARGQTGKHLCRQQCVRNNVSSFARALISNRGTRELGNGLLKDRYPLPKQSKVNAQQRNEQPNECKASERPNTRQPNKQKCKQTHSNNKKGNQAETAKTSNKKSTLYYSPRVPVEDIKALWNSSEAGKCNQDALQ